MKRLVDFVLRRDISLLTLVAFACYLTWFDVSPAVALALLVALVASNVITSWWERRKRDGFRLRQTRSGRFVPTLRRPVDSDDW